MKYEMSIREVLECRIAVEADSVEEACAIRREIVEGFRRGKYLMSEVCQAGEPTYGYLKGVDDFKGPYSLSFGVDDPEFVGTEETPQNGREDSDLAKIWSKAPKMVKECVNFDSVHDLDGLRKAAGDLLEVYEGSRMLRERYNGANVSAVIKFCLKLDKKLAS